MHPLCVDYLHTHTPVLCVPFHHRCWHEIRTVWFACGGNVDRIQDKIGLHVNAIRKNFATEIRLHLRGIRAVLGCICMEY